MLVNLRTDPRYKHEFFSKADTASLQPGDEVTVGWKRDGFPTWEDLTIEKIVGSRFYAYSKMAGKMVSFSASNISQINGRMPSGDQIQVAWGEWLLLAGGAYLLWRATR